MKKEWLLVIIVLLAASLRLYKLNFESPSLSELKIALVAAPDNHVHTVSNLGEAYGGKAFYLVAHVLMRVQFDPFLMRVLNCVCGVASIIVIFHLFRHLLSVEASLLGGLIFSVNSFHIALSQDGNSYSFSFLFICLSFMYLIRWIETKLDIDLALYTITSIFALHSSTYAWISLMSQITALFVIAVYFGLRRQDIAAISISLVSILLFAPWHNVAIAEIIVGHDWTPKFNPYSPVTFLFRYVGKDVFFLALVVSACTALAVWGYSKRTKFMWSPSVVVIIAWAGIPTTYFIVKTMVGNSVAGLYEYFIVTPAIFFWFCYAWDRISNSFLRLGVCMALTASQLVSVFVMADHYARTQPDIRQVVERLTKEAVSGEKVFTNNAWELSYYFKKTNVDVQPLAKLADAGQEPFWLLVINDSMPEVNFPYGVIKKINAYNVSAYLVKKRNS